MERQLSPTQRGTFTRCIEHDEKQIVVSDRNSHSSALVEGDLISYQVSNGFMLHGGVTDELVNFQVISTAQKSVILTILLEGKLDFSYDDLSFQMDTKMSQEAVVVNLTKPASFRRQIHKNNRVSKLNVVIPTHWLEERMDINCNINSFIFNHLSSFKLVLTKPLLELAADIIRLSSPTVFMEKVKLEALTQLLLVEVFKQLSHYKSEPRLEIEYTKEKENKNSFDHSLDGLIKYIEENLEQDLNATHLSEYAAMSISKLQRRFKNALGFSVQSYIRRRRLELAKQQLERGTITITEAAYSAGYRHPSNFTNAFKKIYGLSPQDMVSSKHKLVDDPLPPR